jgi:PPOX class probable F420-dependent enzyme
MALQIDTSTEYGQRVQRRLRDEPVIWLTTVNGKGTPQPSPVWFLWQDGDTLLIYSQPDKPKLRNIAARPQVALAFNTDAVGDDVIVFTGTAEIVPQIGPATGVPAFIAKYETGIANLNSTPDRFAADYSVPVRVTLDRVRGF